MVYETSKGHDAEVNLFIKGTFLNDGKTPIGYLLTITDPNGWNDCAVAPNLPSPAKFPPIGDTICMLADKWVMKTGQKGKVKGACTGSDDFPDDERVLIILGHPKIVIVE